MKTKIPPCVDCAHCAFTAICRDYLFQERLGVFVDSLQRKSPYKKGDIIFNPGEPVRHLIALRSGFIKIYDADDQLRGVMLPGQLIGSEDMFQCRHQRRAVAATDVTVCLIDSARIYLLSQVTTHANRHFLDMFSKAASEYQEMLTVMMQSTAQKKVSAFFALMMTRNVNGGFQKNKLSLPLTQKELASLLGISPMTLRRVITGLIKEKTISITRDGILILNKNSLADGTSEPESGTGHFDT
ncbi:Crp/Fnr family transcriptional regulator [Salmonella enterica subsp. enterica serovar Panama]|nr:Crp/Fnr family transcriptional regulator [Salmonella enterica subsp. enterica serovar Panama]HCM4742657.1 Crp/Fnr family transcriptional regulator [Salmonella enterica subsp. enterica serovar Panama]